MVVNVNASPLRTTTRTTCGWRCLQTRAAAAGAPIVYVNTVGGQDELVFDGDSMVVLHRRHRAEPGAAVRRGRLPRRHPGRSRRPAEPSRPPRGNGASRGSPGRPAPGATDSAPALDLAAGGAVVTERIGDEAEVWNALVLGLRDYVVKNGFRSVVLGVSGGIDSAVVAAIAADAIGGANVHGIALPSAYSSEHSRSDAEDLARRIGRRSIARWRSSRDGRRVRLG